MPKVAVSIAPVGLVAAATMLFRENGNLHVAAVVKATFTFSHHGPMRATQPEPIFTREAHRLNNPTRSIVATSDLVPRLPAVDVILLGHAYAPGGSATHSHVRLAVGRGQSPILDKVVHVVGERKGHEIKPFRSIPLVYEKAYGGPGYRDNPLGTGVLAGDPPPNIVDPQGGDRAAGFAPISRSWPARTALAPHEVRSGLDKPIAELPPGFDLRYFHSAPPDQRPQHLLGDEWILLEGVHPEHQRIHMQLPGPLAMVRIVGTEADGRVFSLRADTLRIDADTERCTIVWRNSLRVRESDLGALQLYAGVALPDAPIAWPERAPAPKQLVIRAEPSMEQAAGGTMLLEDSNTVSAGFGGTMEVMDEDIESVHFDGDSNDFSATAVLGGTLVPVTSPVPAIPLNTLPFDKPDADSAPGPPAPPDASRARSGNEGTLDLGSDFAAIGREIMPFAGRPAAERAAPRHPASSTPIPGSPFQVPSKKTGSPNEDSVTFDASNLDEPEPLDLAGTLASPGSTVPGVPGAQLSPPRVIVSASAAAPPPRIEIQNKPEPPSIFAHQSPDSAPTKIRELAPAAAELGERPAPLLGALSEPPESTTTRLPERPEMVPPAEPARVEPIAEPALAEPAKAAPPEPSAKEPAAPPADPWGQALRDEGPKTVPKAPVSRPSEAHHDLRGTLYKRFKK